MKKFAINNAIWQPATVTQTRREKMNGHRGAVLWFTGLSGSGKSTLAHEVEEALHIMGCHTFVFDGDNVRHGLCSDLGFSEVDRVENIRRIGEMVYLFTQAGMLSLTAFISPFVKDRQRVREMFSANDFIEVYCKCSIEICEQRDKKGLYKLARAGEVKNFTGISSPYEEPKNAELVINTGEQSLKESVEAVINTLRSVGVIQANT